VTLRRIELSFALLLSVSPAAADCIDTGINVIDAVRARHTLRVATTGDYRPFSFTQGDEPHMGIDADAARALADELDVQIEWVVTSWATLVDDLAAQRYDIAMSGISITPARAAVGCFSTPYFTTGKTVLARCSTKQRYTTVAQIDRADVSVIVNPGGTNEQFVRTQLPHARVIVHPDNRTIFDALAGGAADVMITDAVEAHLEAAAHPELCVPTSVLFERVEKAYLMPRDPAWRAWIDAWLARMNASGEFAEMTRRYLPAPLTGGP
jgi:cyclohexadienyl dehydratase